MNEIAPGTLYLVGTPIGNLGDCSSRVRDTLVSVDKVACESIQATRHLFRALGLKVEAQLVSYREANAKASAEGLIRDLEQGCSVALVSDAGMPGVSDPGAHLVALAHQSGIPVRVVPGPSALSSALSASGLAVLPISFWGFLPKKASRRRELMLSWKKMQQTIVFFESPHQLLGSLKDLEDIFGDSQKVYVGRELTKLYEEHLYEPVTKLLDNFSNKEKIKGEFVVALESSPVEETCENQLSEDAKALGELGITGRQAVEVLKALRQCSKKEAYTAVHDI